MAPTRARGVRLALTASALLLVTSCSAAASSASPSVSPRADTASASASPSAAASGPGSNVDVVLKDFSITTSQHAVAGLVSFNVTNKGTMIHEFDIYQSSLPLDSLPLNSSLMVDESNPKVKTIEASLNIPAGTSQTITVTLSAGHYYLVCNQPGHYKLGMRLEYIVGP
jgi:uncharacterized cupredoxin-like copper-binding protein